MLAVTFPGAERLVGELDAAVSRDCPDTITRQLCTTMCQLIRSPDVQLPRCVFESASDHYARRELYRSESLGYSVIAMTWGPGQGTAIHDHDGMWCVEGVWHGQIEVVPYELVQRDDARYRFEPRGVTHAGAGSAGSLLPPHEYHTIRNPSDDDVAVTLHIYRGPMTSCSVFRAMNDGWFVRDERQLSLDRTY